MKDNQILDSLKRSADRAPIDILDGIKEEPRTKMLRHDEITRQDTGMSIARKFLPYASVAAAFLFVLFGWQYQTRMPDSRIYFDVNPSIQFVTNRQDRVIDIKANNEDGRQIIENLDYKGMTIYQVTEEILDRMMNERYLEKDHEFLLLSVYNNNQEKAEQQKLDLDRRIHEYLQQGEFQPIVLSQKLDNTSTIESYAKEFNISTSKMTFIRNLIILNPEFQTEDLVGLSIEELVRLSQAMDLDLDKIIDSTDFERIQTPQPESAPSTPVQSVDDDDDFEDDDFEDNNDDYDEDDVEDDKDDVEDHKDDVEDDKDDVEDHKDDVEDDED